MNIADIRKAKQQEREAISRKIRAGQSFDEHVEEVSAIDLDLLRSAQIIIKGPDGEKRILERDGSIKPAAQN